MQAGIRSMFEKVWRHERAHLLEGLRGEEGESLNPNEKGNSKLKKVVRIAALLAAQGYLLSEIIRRGEEVRLGKFDGLGESLVNVLMIVVGGELVIQQIFNGEENKAEFQAETGTNRGDLFEFEFEK